MEITGDRRIPGCTANAATCFEAITTILLPGSSSDDAAYGFADVDFIKPMGNNLIDFHGSGEVYHLTDGMEARVYDYKSDWFERFMLLGRANERVRLETKWRGVGEQLAVWAGTRVRRGDPPDWYSADRYGRGRRVAPPQR